MLKLNILAAIQCLIFLNDKFIIYSTYDKKNYIADISAQNTSALKNNVYINSAVLSNDKTKIVAALDNGEVFIYDAQSLDKKTVANANLNKKIISIAPSDNNDEYYILMHTGELVKWNSANNNTKEVFSRSRHIASSLTAIPDKNLLVVCYADGTIFYFDTKNDQVGYEFSGGKSKVESAVYDPKTQLLALIGSDKRITLLDTKDFASQPFYIEENNLRSSRVNSVRFNQKGILFALTDKNQILYWDSDINQYAKSLETLNLQPLTANEKSLVLGREFAGGW